MKKPLHPGLETFDRGVGTLLAHVATAARQRGTRQDITEAATLVAEHHASARTLRTTWHTVAGAKSAAEHGDGLLGRAQGITARLKPA